MIEDEKPFTLPAAWELFRDAVRWLGALFGAPGDLKLAGSYSRKDHHLLLSWLRSLEALASRLLLIAAAEVKLTDTSRRQRAGSAGRRRARAWRVRFHMQSVQRLQRRGGPRRSARKEERLFFDTRGPAARFEALRRVAVNPIAYAVRLARRLQREPDLPRRMAQARLRPRDPFAPNAEAAALYMRDVFPAAFRDSS